MILPRQEVMAEDLSKGESGVHNQAPHLSTSVNLPAHFPLFW